MKCEMCSNEYDKAFTVTLDGQDHIFDSFECAINALAPTCEHRVIGHGVEQGAMFFAAPIAPSTRESRDSRIESRRTGAL